MFDFQTAIDTAAAFVGTHWGWSLTLAVSSGTLALAAVGLLTPQRKDEIALWLMGAHSDESRLQTSALLSARLRLSEVFDVAGQPVRMVSITVGLCVLLGAMTTTTPRQRDQNSISLADRWVCSAIYVEDVEMSGVCQDQSGQIAEDEFYIGLHMLACTNGVTPECVARARDAFAIMPKEAHRDVSLNCEDGDGLGCTYLGVLYEHGVGFEQNFDQARRLYGEGCTGGNARGCSNLGSLHESGLGGAPNSVKAHGFYLKGCDGGDDLGCRYAALSYKNGIGVYPDPDQARMYFGEACALGLEIACEEAAALGD